MYVSVDIALLRSACVRVRRNYRHLAPAGAKTYLGWRTADPSAPPDVEVEFH